jgi:hypothetical protein
MLRLAFWRGLAGGFVAGASSFAGAGGMTPVATIASSANTKIAA